MKKQLLSFLVIVLTALHIQAQTPNLWGMTDYGGVNKDGTIFYYNLSTDSETDAYDFGSGTDGKYPYGGLIQANNGLLYGMTAGGGAAGDGILFSYNIVIGTETDIHDFGMDTDGQLPYGSLTPVNDSLLFGMTSIGGTNSYGVIFKYNISSGTYAVVHNFGTGTDGQSPQGSLLLVGDSVLIGMTHHGGVNAKGTLFSYNIKTGNETILHSFGNGSNDGTYPYGSLIRAGNGLLYGMTTYGGSLVFGTLFSYSISNGTLTILHNFGGPASGTNGWYPYGSMLQANDSLLYGLTYQGGGVGAGLMYSYNISSTVYTDIHDFDEVDTDASGPYSTLIQASDSLLYATTYWGGNAASGGQGSIFSYNIKTADERVVHRFGDGNDGKFPYYGSLLEADLVATAAKQLSVNSNQLTVYPNPSTGLVTITSTQNISDVTVINLVGQLILAQPALLSLGEGQGVRQLDLSTYPAGMYFITVKTGDETETSKIVVAH